MDWASEEFMHIVDKYNEEGIWSLETILRVKNFKAQATLTWEERDAVDVLGRMNALIVP